MPDDEPVQVVKVTHIIKKGHNWNKWFFPGVIFHELAHYIASVLLGSRVTGSKFWGEKQAAITHEQLGDIRDYFISAAPFIFGSALALVFIFLAQTGARSIIGLASLAQVIVLYYLGMSAAYHCFPSQKDAVNAIESLNTFYSESLTLGRGVLSFVVALTLIALYPVFLLAAVLMGFFSTVYGFGIVWFVVLFFISGKFLI